MSRLQSVLIGVFVIVLAGGLILCLYIAATRSLSSNETLMIGILVSIFSVLISWILTHLYSQITLRSSTEEVKQLHKENIHTYAVKAAEKVFNLSNELDRLNNYLKNIDYSSIDNAEIEVLVLNERLHATIHLADTLKSMNDTFLSDWKGVIGDEIRQQQYLEQQINEIQEQLESQQRTRELLEEHTISYEDLETVQQRIEEMERRLGEKISRLPFRVRPVMRPVVRQDIPLECPNCASVNVSRLRTRKGARKLISCNNCGQSFKVEFEKDGSYKIEKVPHVDFTIACILCSCELRDTIPDYPGATRKITCSNCDLEVTVAKTKDGVNADAGYHKRLPRKFIEKVLENLPITTPWPKGIHKVIAERLHVSNSAVSGAIAILIEEGRVSNVPAAQGGK
jgi:hypothetical protein